jgi:hypothetical protein
LIASLSLWLRTLHCGAPTLSDAERLSERLPRIDAARLLLLGERLARLVLLLFGEVGRDELEVIVK